MSLSARVKGRTAEDLSSKDIITLLNGIEEGGAESFKPARLLVEAAERHPSLVAQHHDRLASVLNTVLPPIVRQQLYDVVLETDISSPDSLERIIGSAEEDLIEGDPTTRAYVYRIIERAVNEGVSVDSSCLEALITGIAGSPADTPATAAMNAYVAVVTGQDSVGNKELAPLIDFIESDFPEIRSAAFEALVGIVNYSEIEPDTNKEGVRTTLQNYELSSVSADRTADALEKLS